MSQHVATTGPCWLIVQIARREASPIIENILDYFHKKR